MTGRLPTSGAALASLALLAAGAVLVANPSFAAGAGPFGVGLPEAGIGASSNGWLSGFFGYVSARQSEFYRALTAAISALGEDGRAFWGLGSLAFLYGIFHAAGPGHGKAIISSYLLASRQTLRNGIVLSFVSAFAQAMTAIGLVGIAAALLGITGIAMTGIARNLEIGSYAIVTLLGVWLVWSRILRPMLVSIEPAPSQLVPAGAVPEAAMRPEGAGGGGFHVSHHCHHDGCAHAPIPGAGALAGPLDWRRTWLVVASIGFRPCTGALIALVFALSQGLFAAGVFAAFAMALGTGLTVAILAAFAVGARESATRLAGRESRFAARLHRGVEMAGSLAVLAFGLILLSAATGWAG